MKVLTIASNFPDKFYPTIAPWSKRQADSIKTYSNVDLEVIVPRPFSLPVKFLPYSKFSKLPKKEMSEKRYLIYYPRFPYLLPKSLFFTFTGNLFSYFVNRHISKNILNRFPEVISQLESEFERQKHSYNISLNTVVNDPSETFERFSRHFQLGKIEREAIDWAWPLEMNPDGNNNMLHIINTITRSAKFNGLSSLNVFHLQKTAGNILAMLK